MKNITKNITKNIVKNIVKNTVSWISTVFDNIRISKFFIALVIIYASLSALTTDNVHAAPTNKEFRNFIEMNIWQHVKQKGFSRAIFNKAFKNAQYLKIVKKAQDRQPEFSISIKTYLEKLVSDTRIKKGWKKKKEFESVLDALEVIHGVERFVVLAIWGIETNYGQNKGRHYVFSSLATMAYLQKRQKFAMTQIVYALKILRDKHVKLANMRGSWAAAMGHTQFIPSSYDEYAVDFDGDKKKNIWNSIPDALASTANYLKKFGWNNDYPWGVEVKLPQNFDYTLVGLRKKKSIDFWRKQNVKNANGQKLPHSSLKVSLILPMGSEGIAFLVTDNFRAIMKYNHSVSYALAVALLSDNLKERKELYGEWPNQRYNLSGKHIKQIQQKLKSKGYDVGDVDGVFGVNSQKVLRQYQHDNNLIADGYPDRDLLEHFKINPL